MALEPLAAPRAAGGGATAPARAVALLDFDPDVGAQLTSMRFAMARSELRVHVLSLGRGEWAGGELASISPSNVGLLLLEGVVAREVVLEDTIST